MAKDQTPRVFQIVFFVVNLSLLSAFLLTCLSGLFIGKMSPDPSSSLLSSQHEVVLTPGDKLIAENLYGSFSIAYVDETTRLFTFEGREFLVPMIPRDKPFSFGVGKSRYGIYQPASRSIWDKTTVRVIAVEEHVHFETEEELYRFIKVAGDYDWVYTEDGLMAGAYSIPSENVFAFQIYQLNVQGSEKLELETTTADQVRIEQIESVDKP